MFFKCQLHLTLFLKKQMFALDEFTNNELKKQIKIFKSFHPHYISHLFDMFDYTQKDIRDFIFFNIYLSKS